MPCQELAILPSENIIRHCCDAKALSECFAQSQHESRLPRAYWSVYCQSTYYQHAYALFLPSNAYCESPVFPISALDDRHLSPDEATGAI